MHISLELRQTDEIGTSFIGGASAPAVHLDAERRSLGGKADIPRFLLTAAIGSEDQHLLVHQRPLRRVGHPWMSAARWWLRLPRQGRRVREGPRRERRATWHREPTVRSTSKDCLSALLSWRRLAVTGPRAQDGQLHFAPFARDGDGESSSANRQAYQGAVHVGFQRSQCDCCSLLRNRDADLLVVIITRWPKIVGDLPGGFLLERNSPIRPYGADERGSVAEEDLETLNTAVAVHDAENIGGNQT